MMNKIELQQLQIVDRPEQGRLDIHWELCQKLQAEWLQILRPKKEERQIIQVRCEYIYSGEHTQQRLGNQSIPHPWSLYLRFCFGLWLCVLLFLMQ